MKASEKAKSKPKAKAKAKGKAKGKSKAKDCKEDKEEEETAEVDALSAPAGSKTKKRPAAASEPVAAEGPCFGFQVCSKISKTHVLDFV